MSKVMYKSIASYVSCRAGIYYYTRRVPYDVRQHYASHRLSFSLRTKSNAGALRAAQSVTQRLEDYWLGLRLQNMDIPAIHLVKASHVDDSSPLMIEAVDNYLRIKGNDDRTFVRAASACINGLAILGRYYFPIQTILRRYARLNLARWQNLKMRGKRAIQKCLAYRSTALMITKNGNKTSNHMAITNRHSPLLAMLI